MIFYIYQLYYGLSDSESGRVASGFIEEQLSSVLEGGLFNPRTIAVVMLSFLTKLYLTTIAGVDWMLHETAAQRKFENMWKAKDELEAMKGGDMKFADLAEMKDNRKRHLDAFVELSNPKRAE